MADSVDRLASEGVEFVQVLYTELHGVCRGKEVPIEEIHHKVESGIGLTEAIMTIDLGHNVISGFEHGFRDIFLVPDLSRLWRVPWDPATAWCMGDLREGDGTPYAADPRHAVRRAVEELAARGLHAIVAPELEFYLVDPDTYETYTPHLSSVYTVGSVSDPKGVFREIHRNARDLGLHPLGGAQEYGCGQFEINLAHGEALEVADRNLLFKTMVKQTASRHGLLATFMGKLRDDEGSGHARPRLADARGRRERVRRPVDARRPVRPRPPVRRRRARAHARADGVLLPDGERLPADAGREPRADAHQLGRRQPARDAALPGAARQGDTGRDAGRRRRRGHPHAPSRRCCSPASTASIAASQLPSPCEKLPYEDETTLGDPLPSSLGEALDALAAD